MNFDLTKREQIVTLLGVVDGCLTELGFTTKPQKRPRYQELEGELWEVLGYAVNETSETHAILYRDNVVPEFGEVNTDIEAKVVILPIEKDGNFPILLDPKNLQKRIESAMQESLHET